LIGSYRKKSLIDAGIALLHDEAAAFGFLRFDFAVKHNFHKKPHYSGFPIESIRESLCLFRFGYGQEDWMGKRA
jgi:hypothetical protein